MNVSRGNLSKGIRWLLPIVTLLLVFGIVARPPIDPDMWWHLRAGEEQVLQSKIITHDVFSYTRYGATWTNAFWLSDIGMYLLWRTGGFLAITVMVSILATLTFGLVYAQLNGHIFLRAALTLLAAFVAAPVWSVRPQLVSFLLLALLDFGLFSYKRTRRPHPWLLIPLFALWANLHGGFIWGIFLLIAFLVGETLNNLLGNLSDKSLSYRDIKIFLAYSLSAGLAVLLNPNGFALWRLPFNTVDVSLISIKEWLSPNFHIAGLHPILWLLFLLIVGLAFSKKQMDFSDLIKVLGFTYLTFISQRNMAPFAIVIAPVVSRHLTGTWNNFKVSPLGKLMQRSQAKSSQPLLTAVTLPINLIIVTLLGVAGLFRVYSVSLPEVIESQIPAQAVRWIETNHPPGRLFNSYLWGGYLTWALRDYPVFIDGRSDLFGNEIISQWLAVVEGTDKGFAILERWGVRLIVIEPNWSFVEDLPARGWNLLFRDDKVFVFGR